MSPSILLLAALAGQPRPSDGPTRNELVAEAVECFRADDHQGAIDAFERAYALDQRAVDLFNIGRIYEEMGRPQKARAYYRRFLADPSLTAEERREGKERIAALPPPPRAVAEPDAAPTELAPSHADRPHWTIITGATLLPVGGVALLSGGILAHSAMNNARNAEKSASDQTPAESTPHYTMARRQAVSADVLLAIGGTLAATGATMLTVGLVRRRGPRNERRRERGERAKVAVAPLGAGLRLDVRF